MIKLFKDLVIGGTVIFLTICIAFLSFEPSLGFAVEDQFTVNQSVTAEISFLVPATNVAMNGTILGLTGGTANGQTQVVVLTNNALGYTMTITASASPALRGNSQGGSIPDYAPAAAGIPDYSWVVPGGGAAKFGFTASASTTSELAQKFKDNGSNTCNTGANDTTGGLTCWMGLSTVATSTIYSTTETPASGSTSTLYFKVQIASGSAIPQDSYTATATLTATAN